MRIIIQGDRKVLITVYITNRNKALIYSQLLLEVFLIVIIKLMTTLLKSVHLIQNMLYLKRYCASKTVLAFESYDCITLILIFFGAFE